MALRGVFLDAISTNVATCQRCVAIGLGLIPAKSALARTGTHETPVEANLAKTRSFRDQAELVSV
jgi:hypothetical protein